MNNMHIHIVGICGSATNAIGVALACAGHKVTGSDKGFYPPASTMLEQAGVPFWAGWHPEKFEEVGTPELFIAGGSGTSENNPEIKYAREHNIDVISFAEAVARFIIRDTSIVCAGTWGKTTTSSLLSYVLNKTNNASYFTGGVSLSHPSAGITDGVMSVVEGDEYKVSISNEKPKFVYYKPSHVLLTAVSWDHADLYPTEQSYFDAFTALTKDITDEHIVACIDNTGIKKVLADKKYISYGEHEDAQYRYHNIVATLDGITFTITHNDQETIVTSNLLGAYNAENITGVFAMLHTLGIAPEQIVEHIKTFRGIKRRLERRNEGDVLVIDDIAHSGDKVKSLLETLRISSTGHITCIFEPNIGGRVRNAQDKYTHAFKDADTVIIPRLTKLKTAENTETPLDGVGLADIISQTHTDVEYIDNDTALIEHITRASLPGDIIVFAGAHGFRGMIEETVEALENRA